MSKQKGKKNPKDKKKKKKAIKTKIPKSMRLSKLKGTSQDPRSRSSRLRGF